MNKLKRTRRPVRYAVLHARLAEDRWLIGEIVVNVRNSWHRYQYAQLYDTVEHRVAFRSSVVFGLRRFAEEYERLLLLIATEFDGGSAAGDEVGLTRQMSVYVKSVRPRVVPVGLRHVLARHLALRYCCPEELADDQLRVLAIGLWGLWERLEDALREFQAWLKAMAAE